jgi:hypothetical protein
MDKNTIIHSIEQFHKTDCEIEKLFELSINSDAREEKIDDCKASIARREESIGELYKKKELGARQFKHYTPSKAKAVIEKMERSAKETRLELARKIALDKTLVAKIASKDLAIEEFNRLVRVASNSSLLEWLEKECNLSMIVTKLSKKNISYYMPSNFMNAQFDIDKGYLTLLLARIISTPILNYLNIPEKLPDKATFNRAGKLATELLELVEKHESLTPLTMVDSRGYNRAKSVLSQIAIDHLSQPQETRMIDRPQFKETVMAFVRPLESLKEIRYEEQRRLKTQLLFEDMGVRYINTFALDNNTKGRPHSEIISALIPHSFLGLNDMPDIRTVQRWLSSLDGYGTAKTTRSPDLHRPFTRNGKPYGHGHNRVKYVRRLIDKPNLKDSS